MASPSKIISIVPSLTEFLWDIGIRKELVGRTKFCIHPKDGMMTIPKIGGTKNVNIEKVKSLKPDIIIANKEENTREDVEALREFAEVYVSNIGTYDGAISELGIIGDLVGKAKETKSIIDHIKRAHDIHKTDVSTAEVAYLIWKDPYMTVGNDTFIHDMMERCGWENIFGDQQRYPQITLKEIMEKAPKYIFLSSEPYPFGEKHLKELAQRFPDSKVVLVDGEMFSWYGSRMLQSWEYFKTLKNQLS